MSFDKNIYSSVISTTAMLSYAMEIIFVTSQCLLLSFYKMSHPSHHSLGPEMYWPPLYGYTFTLFITPYTWKHAVCSICIWLCPLCIIPLRCIHAYAHLAFIAEQDSFAWIYNNIFIHLPVDENLGCIHVLIIIRKLLSIFKYRTS